MTGVASRVDPTLTAFAHRARQYDCLILSQWDDPAESEENIAWTRSLFEAMSPFLETGVYMNNLGDEGRGRVKDAYGANYDRLATVKAAYDPGQPLPLQPRHCSQAPRGSRVARLPVTVRRRQPLDGSHLAPTS
jgi:hypothetical protein